MTVHDMPLPRSQADIDLGANIVRAHFFWDRLSRNEDWRPHQPNRTCRTCQHAAKTDPHCDVLAQYMLAVHKPAPTPLPIPLRRVAQVQLAFDLAA